jgi:hypothetical protein
MKLYLVIQVSLMLLSGRCFSQTDSFDVYTYKAPVFFTKSELPSGLQFTMSNVDGSYCTITMYKSQPTKEDPAKDIISQWNDKVVKRLTKAGKKPGKILTGQVVDGWASTLAIGNFYHKKKKSVVILNSNTRDQTSACIVFAFSDPIFKGTIESFSKNVHLHH